jgi:hypothetical protein
MNINESWYGPACYQIKVKGHKSNYWSDWFEGMTIFSEAGVTTITGEIVDQAALHGFLIRIRDMGLQLISVNLIESNQVDEI